MRAHLVVLLLLSPAVAQDVEVGFRDDFVDVAAWLGNNPRAPAAMRGEGGLLHLTDPPGGEVTWGTSIARDLGVVDLGRTPWFVARIAAATGTFQAKLINLDTREKSEAFASLAGPGLAICNVAEQLGWRARARYSLSLYVQGTERSLSVDWVKLVSALTVEEQRAAPQRQAARAAQPYHGLTALARRQAWRPREAFTREGQGLSERVIYQDSVTGNQVWQMTVDPAVDQVAYYDLPEWSATGSLLMFQTWRSRERLWVMKADGTGLRPLFAAAEESESGSASGYWSSREPSTWWLVRKQADGTAVVAFDVVSGRQTVVARTSRPGLDLFPPHPTEQWFLLAKNGTADRDCEVVVLDRAGREQVVPVGGRFHRLRFAKGPTPRVFFNRDDPRTQWVIEADGTGRTELPDPGSHPDWTLDGRELTYFGSDGVYATTPDGQHKRTVFQTGSGGHGGPSNDGAWFIADQSGGLFPQSIVLARLHGGEVNRLAWHGSRMMSHDEASAAHPAHHSTHPHPSFSPDGTKAVFSSYADRAFVDLHVAVCRYPDPPREVNLRVTPAGPELRWAAPERSREVAGYAVYRSPESGTGYVAAHDGLVPGPTWLDRVATGLAHYVVVAVEASGLAGRPSAEVTTMGWPERSGAAACYRRWAEAEDGRWTAPARTLLATGEHSAGFAVGLGAAGEARLVVPLEAPVAGPARLWLRALGPGPVTVGEQRLDLPPGWHWSALGQQAAAAGPRTVELRWDEPRLRVDRLLLTNDPAFVPTGQAMLDTVLDEAALTPRNLRARTMGDHQVELTWDRPPARDVRTYHVYAVATPEAYGSQASRIGSPAEPRLVDWGLDPGTTGHYRVTAEDRFGHESPPSAPVSCTVPEGRLTTIDLGVAEAERDEAVQLGDAPGGGRLALAVRDDAELRWAVDLPAADEYAVWLHHLVPQPKAVRQVLVRWDDGEWQPVTLYGAFARPAWWPLCGSPSATPTVQRLPAGRHTLAVRLRGTETGLLGCRVTSDPRAMPRTWGGEPVRPREERPVLIEPQGKVLFTEDFRNLEGWHHEGVGEVTLAEPGTMKLAVLGSKQGAEGCHAFCRTPFPDHVALEYDLQVLSPNGLVITFVAMAGLQGENLLTIPGRTGVFADYVGPAARLRSYHVSVSRYDDDGVHTGVSNWRRNPGLHLMAQGPDLCREIQRWYRIRIVKDGRHLQLQVNGEVAHEFTDPGALPTPLPTAGQVGFRAIGSDVRALVRNLRVVALR